VLLKQEYSADDDRDHIKYLIPLFKDSRYIKVGDKPVFCIYKPDLFPNISNTLTIFREEAKKEGIDLYICRFERWNGWEGKSINDLGFDAAVDFQPLSVNMRKFINSSSHINSINLFRKRLFKWLKYRKMPQWLLDLVNPLNNDKDTIIDYRKYISFDLSQRLPDYKLFPGVSPMWDNSSRRKNISAIIFKNSTPELFQFWYKEKCNKFLPYSNDEDFLFINAWNEWAEGNHLEPCQKWGTAYLEALK
jgi:hypothetical protein